MRNERVFDSTPYCILERKRNHFWLVRTCSTARVLL